MVLTSRYLVIHGYRRAFLVEGEGPALLLIHGIGDSSATWRHIVPALAKCFTVIAPDLLGHGGSDKPRADYSGAAYACGMRDLLAVLEIEKATVVGHSLGGAVAMQFAYQFPERCERLVLVGTGGVGREVHAVLKATAAPGSELLLPLLTAMPARVLARALSPLARLAGGLGLEKDFGYVFDRYWELSDRTARQAFLRTLRSGVDRRGQVISMLDRCYLARGVPTLLVWGARDRVIPVEHAQVAHAAMPGSRLVVFPDAGHFPHHTDPERFMALLRDFVFNTEPAVYDAERWRTLLRAGRAPQVCADATVVQALERTTGSSGS